LAKRDIPGRKYDHQGRRLFDKFEMIVDDDEGDEDVEDGFVEVDVAELIDARVLRAAEGGDKEDMVVFKEEMVEEVVGGADAE
jgi:hypothetical protein